MKIKGLASLLILLLGARSAFSVCEECLVLPGQNHRLEATVKRLKGIIKENEDFSRNLDPADQWEQTKVNSNLSIAKKRIMMAETEIDRIHGKMINEPCKGCLEIYRGGGS